MKKQILCALTFCATLLPMNSSAQLSSNPDKFLGNITTRYQMDAGGGVPKFYQLWNQVTCENESKWGSVEGTKGSYNWGCDNAFNYAKQHNFTYKFHALVWGSQYPTWIEKLSYKDRYAAIVKWYDAVKKKYPNLPMIDVVNEAVDGHQAGTHYMKEALGGGGKTGYDWLIKAFELAYERFPNSILIYNDFNTFQWNTSQYIELVQAIRDGGAPIDAYGCQSHDLKGFGNLPAVDKNIQNALLMPMYITEYDIQEENDQKQLNDYKSQIPYLWERDYCAGITLWGYVYGATWNEGTSGIYRNGQERAAMTWLKEYMATDAAKQAKSPFPGMKKEASIYIRPASFKVAKGDKTDVKVRVKMATKTVAKVELYDGSNLIATMTEEPYITEYTSTSTGLKTLKAVVTTTDGSTYERQSRINVTGSTKREPYNGTPFELPGTIVVKEYDKGTSGVTYSGASRTLAMKDGQWMDYTVDVKEDGVYMFDAEVAAAKSGGIFHIAEYGLDNLDFLTEFVEVPKTGGISAYQTLHGKLQLPLTAGRHVFTLLVDKGGFYFKNLTIRHYEEDKQNITVAVSSVKPATISAGDSTVITVTATSKQADVTIDSVMIYSNDLLIGTLKESPYQFVYYPTEKGSYSITAIAVNSAGKAKTSTKKTLKVNGKRIPYKGVIEIPGIVQAENFDQGGEGLTFHDSDTNDEGDAKYRTDNEGLDLVKGNNGTAIGYTASGEWTEYSVNVVEPGEYSYEATVSNGGSSNGSFTIYLKDSSDSSTKTSLAKVTITPSGGWGTYKKVTGKLTKNLAEGEQIFRFDSPTNCNIDKVEFICTLNTGIEVVQTAQPVSRAATFNLSGQKVGADYRGIVIRNGRKILRR